MTGVPKSVEEELEWAWTKRIPLADGLDTNQLLGVGVVGVMTVQCHVIVVVVKRLMPLACAVPLACSGHARVPMAC